MSTLRQKFEGTFTVRKVTADNGVFGPSTTVHAEKAGREKEKESSIYLNLPTLLDINVGDVVLLSVQATKVEVI